MVKPKSQKPRIRKSAPTVRERVEAAQAEAQKPSKIRKTGKVLSKVRLNLPNNRLGKGLGRIGRLLGKILGWLLPRYFINSWREIRQVTWPARKETWRLTLAVFIFALVFGLMVYAVDKVLEEVFKKFVLK